MTQRNPAAVFILCFITLGIYGLVWYVKTKGEMNARGADIPTAWLIIIPIVNFFWLWKWSQGVEKVTGGSTSAGVAFILMFLLGPIGAAIIQSKFNGVSGGPAAAPQAPKAESSAGSAD
jgi:membrane protease YdiL (CAAX protease family)